MDFSHIEQEFRSTWTCYDPNRYEKFLSRVEESERLDLLVILLGVELEFSFQTPKASDSNATMIVGEHDEDDDRVLPNVQLFLLRFPELKRSTDYVIQLAITEFAFRLRYDAIPPNPDSYLTLIDDSHEKFLRLLRLTENKIIFMPSGEDATIEPKPHDSTIRESGTSNTLVANRLSVNLGYFILTRVIGNGGMGVVHEAIDLRNAVQVAVKVMRRGDPFSIYQFKEEFTWLSKLNHPNLVRLFDTFSENHNRYFSMELVEGKDIRKWFQRIRAKKRKSDPWQALKHVLRQTASAIHFLHEKGVIHCDVKPSNLLITRRKRAVLLDLGLALREGAARTTVGDLVGTLQYMAPEVIEGGKPTRASDWYSFGILIFETVADCYPPVKLDLDAEEIQDKYTFNQQLFNEQLLTVDPQIASLLRDLLTPNADDRPTGSQILRRLGGFEEDAAPLNSECQIVGRQSEVEKIQAAYEASKESASALVVHGETGFGKTTIVEDWRNVHVDESALQVNVECFRQDHTALRLLNSIVQELAEVLVGKEDQYWRESLEQHAETIANEFPQIHQLLEEDLVINQTKPAVLNEESRQQAIDHLLLWLEEISLRERLLITADNCQWADIESLQILARLVSSSMFRGFVLLVEDNSESNLIDILDRSTSRLGDQSLSCDIVYVGPLDQDDSIAVVNQLAELSESSVSPEIAKSIADRSGGSTFILEQLFATYAHFVKESSGTDEEWLSKAPESKVQQGFSQLPSHSETVLQYLAVAGEPVYFYQLEMASRILGPNLQHTLSALTHQGWIRSNTSGFDTSYEISDLVQRVMLESLPVDRLRRRHYRLARTLSSEVPPPWHRVANHFSEAGYDREAATCYWEAARAAFKRSHFSDALGYIKFANHDEADRTASEQTNVDRLEADCLAATGRTEEAAEAYYKLSQAPDIAADEARPLELLAGEQWIRSGELDVGLRTLRAKMREEDLEGKMPDRLHQRSIMLKVLALVATTKPSQFVIEELEPFTELERCLNRLSFVTSFLDNRLGPNLILGLFQRAQKKGTFFDRAIAVLGFALLLRLADPKLRRQANDWLRLGIKLARKSRNPVARGWARHCMYVWRIQQGRPYMAIRHATAAHEWYWRDPKDLFWENQFLSSSMIGPYWHSGQLKRMRAEALALRSRSREFKKGMTQYFCHVGASHWSDLVADDIAAGRNSISQARNSIGSQTFQSPRFFLWHSEVMQLLYEGQAAKARDLILRHWRELEGSYIFSTKHYHWLALWLRMCCNLVCLRQQALNKSTLYRDALYCIRKVGKLKQRAFVAYRDAYTLVLDEHIGKVAATARWEGAINKLSRANHHLTANALRIHQELALELHDEFDSQKLFSTLLSEGCVNPVRMLDIILPLPSHPAIKH